jgi:uncharacterized SAM-binding protein YcdF (DUF218 family)
VPIFYGALFGLLTCILLDDLGLLRLLPTVRRVPHTAPLFIFFGAVLGAVRREKWFAGTTAFCAVLWMVVAFSPLAARLVRPLPMQASATEIARGADAVVVLSSRIQNDGEFTETALQRLMRGLELAQSGRAPLLVLTEVRPPSGSYTSATKELTGKLKISVPITTLKGPMRDTRDEAVAVAKLAKERGWKRILLVTSPTHTRRSAMTFRQASRAQKLIVLPVSSQETTTDLEMLDDPGDRLRAFDMALHEIVGTWVYKLRGWI